MSLLPVSEALQRLENDGVVESVPRVGTRVCLPTPQDIRERYEIREALESQSARLFAEKASPGGTARVAIHGRAHGCIVQSLLRGPESRSRVSLRCSQLPCATASQDCGLHWLPGLTAGHRKEPGS